MITASVMKELKEIQSNSSATIAIESNSILYL